MKKIFICLALSLILANPQLSFASQNPVDQNEGQIWMQATENEKIAFLFGIDSAITIEYFIDKQSINNKNKKKQNSSNLSKFEKGWMEAFKDLKRTEIAKMVDNWYKNNPDKLNRPVMEVLWYECVVPRIKK